MGLVLEPLNFPPAVVYQKALFEAGLPVTALITDDVAADFARLSAKGLKFRGEPVAMGPIIAVLFEDGRGNMINLVQTLERERPSSIDKVTREIRAPLHSRFLSDKVPYQFDWSDRNGT